MPDATTSFVLAFSALFSIVNPVGAALIFSQVTADRTHAERVALARRIGVYSAVIMLGSLWVGAYVLSFFGVSIAALRIAGGLVVASRAWILLNEPEHIEARKAEQAGPAAGEDDVAFFPLTMPFTTGPGTIAVALALGSARPAGTWADVAGFFVACSAAALLISVMVWLLYASADRLVALLGTQQTRVMARLMAFLLLCVGVEITLAGVRDVLGPLLAR
jgi:multiple antibiotic resistance protein